MFPHLVLPADTLWERRLSAELGPPIAGQGTSFCRATHALWHGPGVLSRLALFLWKMTWLEKGFKKKKKECKKWTDVSVDSFLLIYKSRVTSCPEAASLNPQELKVNVNAFFICLQQVVLHRWPHYSFPARSMSSPLTSHAVTVQCSVWS